MIHFSKGSHLIYGTRRPCPSFRGNPDILVDKLQVNERYKILTRRQFNTATTHSLPVVSLLLIHKDCQILQSFQGDDCTLIRISHL